LVEREVDPRSGEKLCHVFGIRFGISAAAGVRAAAVPDLGQQHIDRWSGGQHFETCIEMGREWLSS
jgi:hypothetical protein